MKKILKAEIEASVKAKGLSSLVDLIVMQQDQIGSLEELIRANEAKIRRLDSLHYAMGSIAQECESALVKEISLTAGTALNQADGFYKQETDQRGESYVWTGPDQTFRFILYLSREEECEVSLNIMNFSLSEGLRIDARIDGYGKSWSTKNKANIFTEHRLPLSSEPGRKTPTLLECQVSRMRRPSDENPKSRDDRLIGVAFHSLLVR